ncbi:phosphoribosylformylglycinamidine synthase subunit PurS [Candidatus Margulisiibacteriota bacterium]
MFFAKIYIRLKKGLLDPQGKTIGSALQSLGYKGVSDVKVGKLIEVKLSAKDKNDAAKKVEEICKKLLANPVIEVFEYEIEGTK